MYGWSYSAWIRASSDAWLLSVEAATVVGLRLAKIAAGGAAADAEARLMVTEKVQAGLELQAAMLTGALGTTPLARTQKTVKHYRRKVAANHRRLTRTR